MKVTEHELKRYIFQGDKKHNRHNTSITQFKLKSNFIRQIVTHLPEGFDVLSIHD